MNLKDLENLKVGDLVYWTDGPYPKQLAIITGRFRYKVLKCPNFLVYVNQEYEMEAPEWYSVIKLSTKVSKVLYG